RDDEVQTKIDAAPGSGDGADLVDQRRLECIAGNDVGREGGHAARRSGRRLSFGIAGGPRPSDIGAMAEVDVGIDDTRPDQKALWVDTSLSRQRSRGGDGGDVIAGYANIGLNNGPFRKDCLGTPQYRIEHAYSHRLALTLPWSMLGVSRRPSTQPAARARA